jgi:hypothetical protein
MISDLQFGCSIASLAAGQEIEFCPFRPSFPRTPLLRAANLSGLFVCPDCSLTPESLLSTEKGTCQSTGNSYLLRHPAFMATGACSVEANARLAGIPAVTIQDSENLRLNRAYRDSSQIRAIDPRVRCRDTSSAVQSGLFSQPSFTRFRGWEVSGNHWQAVNGLSTMACYPPHVSKAVRYPGEFRAMRLYRNKANQTGCKNPMFLGMKAFCGYGNKLNNQHL